MAADLNAASDPLIGRKLDGRYEVLERLGSGGAGVVYRGRQIQLGRLVAIKVLHEEMAASQEWRRRFEREAQALSVLAHPNVVPVTDSGIDGGVPFLVMELLQGKTLADLIREGPLPLGRALNIIRQTLRGLAFAHSKGIVHRDLKPTNVFLQALPDHDDHVRLLDFGMVKFLEGPSSRTLTDVTRPGAVVGTPAYLAPDQVKGGPADARTDVYAAGVLLFELLAGRRPFVADSAEGYIGAHLTQPVPSLAKVRRRVPRAAMFQVVIARAMTKNPTGRYVDAAAMLGALEEVAAKLPFAALAGARAEARGKAPRRTRGAASTRGRYWRHAILLATLAVGVAGAEAYLQYGRTKPRATAALPPQPPPRPAIAPPPPAPSPAPAAPVVTATPTATPTPTPTPGEQATAPTPNPAVAAEQAPPAAPAAAAPPPATSPPGPSAPAASAPATSPSAAPPPPQPSPEPAPPSPPPAEAKAKAPVEAPAPVADRQQPAPRPQAEAKPSAGTRDPWLEPVPHPLRPFRDRISHGVRMSQRALIPVYDFARQNPDDPRPWLLLGHAYAQVDWFSDSVERYRKAFQLDSTCRGDPQMLADLLKAAAHPVAGHNAARAIHDIYGAEALPALEKDLERRDGNPAVTARLTRLRDSLAH